MQKKYLKLLIFLGVTVLFSAYIMKTTVTPATASLRESKVISVSPSRHVVVLPVAESPQAALSRVPPFTSLVSFTWNNLVVRTFQTNELLVVQLSQATCYTCHLETKISCLYNIQPFTVSNCTALNKAATELDHPRRLVQHIVDCSSCHEGTEIGFAWQASMQ